MKLLTGNSHPELAESVSGYLGVPIVNCTVGRFANGEVNIKLHECIRNQDVFILATGGSTAAGTLNDLLMETLIMVNACRLSSAKSITVFMACYPYARQDKKDKSRTPISARLMADFFETAGVTRLVAVDLHAAQIQGFFHVPCDNLYAIDVLCTYLRDTIFVGLSKTEIQDRYVFVSPDNGGAKRITAYSKRYDLNNVIMHKERDYSAVNKVEKTILVGEQSIEGKIGIIVDDMCDTMGTVVKACESLEEHGMIGAIVVVTHGVLSGPAAERINGCDFIQKVIVTNTLPQTENGERIAKLEVVDITGLISDAIQCISAGHSMSKLFS